jgi:hypothetical protein
MIRPARERVLFEPSDTARRPRRWMGGTSSAIGRRVIERRENWGFSRSTPKVSAPRIKANQGRLDYADTEASIHG